MRTPTAETRLLAFLPQAGRHFDILPKGTTASVDTCKKVCTVLLCICFSLEHALYLYVI
jgi:hypothetical protein